MTALPPALVELMRGRALCFLTTLMPDGSPQVTETWVDTDGDVLTPGLAGTVRGPLGVAVPFRVLDVEPDGAVRRWTWRVSVGPVSLLLEHAVIPLDAAASGTGPDVRRTATTLLIDGPAPLVLGYAPLAQLALVRLVRR